MDSRATILSTFLVLFASCGQGPVPLSSEASSPSGYGGGHGETASGEDPHAGLATADASFNGTVTLRGNLAAKKEGVVFVSIMPVGVRFPVYSIKLALNEVEGETNEAGDRVLSFTLDKASKMTAGPMGPGDHELQVYLDADGYVETKDEVMIRATLPVKVGDENLAVVLEEPTE